MTARQGPSNGRNFGANLNRAETAIASPELPESTNSIWWYNPTTRSSGDTPEFRSSGDTILNSFLSCRLSGRVFDGSEIIEPGDHGPVSALREPPLDTLGAVSTVEPQGGPSRSTMLTALSPSKGMVEGPLVG
ncbi:hypothetical protein ES708_10786 [subsurface metagenome]